MSTETTNISSYYQTKTQETTVSKSYTDKSDNRFSSMLEDKLTDSSRMEKNRLEEKQQQSFNTQTTQEQPKAEPSKKERPDTPNDKVSHKTEDKADVKEKEEIDKSSSDKKDKLSNNDKNEETNKEDTSKDNTTKVSTESVLANIELISTDVIGAMVKPAETSKDTTNLETAQKAVQTIKEAKVQTEALKTAVKAEENSSVKQISQAIAGDVEAEVSPDIKVSDKVAAAVKEAVTKQSTDMSAKAKEQAMANLQSISGTDTTVVESETSSTNNGSSFSQGNASEQLIKMSVEGTQDSKTASTADFNLNQSKSIQTTINSPAKELNKSDLMNQINNKLNDLQTNGHSKVTIILKPENLGRIHLEIVNSSEGITAKMLTDNQQVKELLDKNMEALKSQLSSQGVNVNNIKIENTQQTANNAMNFEREQFNQQNLSDNSQQKEPNNTSNQQMHPDEGGFENLADIDIEAETSQTRIIHEGKIDYKI